MKLAALIASATQTLDAAGVANPDLDARALITHALGMDRLSLALHGQTDITADQMAQIDELIRRRAARQPLAHITGKRGFWSLDLTVTPDVLDPRPDSECLIEQCLKRLADTKRPYQFADLGTGSGALLLALLHEYPRAQGVGLDISNPAVSIAKQNAAQNGLAARARFVQSRWLDRAEGGPFDLIISNPPYIASHVIGSLSPEVRDHEPHLALDGGPDGLEAYRQLIPQARQQLKAGGLICLEIGFDQNHAVSELLANAGFGAIEPATDLAGNDRCLTAITK